MWLQEHTGGNVGARMMEKTNPDYWLQDVKCGQNLSTGSWYDTDSTCPETDWLTVHPLFSRGWGIDSIVWLILCRTVPQWDLQSMCLNSILNHRSLLAISKLPVHTFNKTWWVTRNQSEIHSHANAAKSVGGSDESVGLARFKTRLATCGRVSFRGAISKPYQ